MTTAEQVQQAASPQAALLVIAEALDRIEAGLTITQQTGPRDWTTDWHTTVVDTPEGVRALMSLPAVPTATYDDDTGIVDIVPVSPERQRDRYTFAKEELRLDVAFPQLGEAALDAYAKGGPQWLYLGERKFVMDLPVEHKRHMIEDVQLDNVMEAQEMGRDILKDKSAGELPSLA